MKGYRSDGLKYSILNDPHMYYYLQSPQKVKELLQTGLYRVDGRMLVEKASKVSFRMDEYVAEKVLK
jgi:hypothetical protein